MISSQQYPIFTKNQVLSEGQMNEILEYLEPQDRLTRTMCIGRGIMCGLDARSTPKRVVLEEGVGLTSAGFILPIKGDKNGERIFRYATAFNDFDSKYAPFWNAEKTEQIELWDLLEQEPPEDDDVEVIPIGDFTLADYAVLLYVADYDVDLTACLANDCDNQGFERNFDVHVLLIKKSDLLSIIRESDAALSSAGTEEQVAAKLLAKYNLKRQILTRPALLTDNVGDYLEITRNYRKVCLNEVAKFQENLTAAYECYQAVVGVKESDVSKAKVLLQTRLDQLPDDRGMQYFWDFLDDLHHAYNEFIDCAFDFACVCGVQVGAFSHHLMLGPAVADSDCKPSIYRHYFAPACEEFSYGDTRQQVRKLFTRLIEMIGNFAFDYKLEDIRITPEKRGGRLGERALPYYYKVDKLRPFWSPDAGKRCQSAGLPSYYREDDKILQLSLEDKNHFRIEGHMYKVAENVVKELDELKSRYNLPFHIQTLELGEIEKGAESGGCNVEDLRILYQINRLEALCFIEDKIRFLSNIVQEDFEPENDEEKEKEREFELKLTPLEKALKLKYADVLDFSRNRVFETQAKIGAMKFAEKMVAQPTKPPVEAEIESAETVAEPTSGGNTGRTAIGAKSSFGGTAVAKAYTPFTGRKTSKYEGIIEEEDLKKETLPKGVETIVESKPSVMVKKAKPGFDKTATPKKTKRRETPVEEDSTALIVKAGQVAMAFPKTPVTDYKDFEKPVLGDRLLQELIGLLTKLLEQIPVEVHDYDVEVTQDAYEVIKDKALALKDIVEDLLGNEKYEMKGVEVALIAELLEIADSCIDERLINIVKMHNEEWEEAENASIFSEFLKQHPGVEHRAGVPKGGTFILVSGTVQKDKRVRTIKELSMPRLYKKPPLAVYDNLRGNVYENMVRSAGFFNRKAFTWSKLIDRKRIKTGAMQSATPSLTLEKNRNALLGSLLKRIEESDEELVVFDFCLPYVKPLCTEVKYVVLAELKLYLPKEMFCIHDNESYAFGVYPPGGVVSGPGVKRVKETYYFTPAGSSVGEQKFSYKIGGKEIQLITEVFPHPEAKFTTTIVSIDESSAVVEFENLSTEATEYEWTFGDDAMSTDHSPRHIYDIAARNSFKVSLEAKSGACSATTSQELTLIPIQFAVDTGKTEFCGSDEASYKLIMEPDGGELDGEAISDDAFVPGDVLLDNASRKEVTLSYTVNEQTAELDLTVYATPQPEFTAELVQDNGTTAVYRFTNKTVNGAAYVWDFGDGGTSTQENPDHSFGAELASTFTVKLTAQNGPCSASVSKKVNISPVTFEQKEGRSTFREDDASGYGFNVSPTGGKITGPGIKEKLFYPVNVDPGSLKSTTVTLVYTVNERSATLRMTVFSVPEVDFSFKQSRVEKGVAVTFNNTSKFADRYVWNFGDGSDEYEGFNANHLYTKEGTYEVTLFGENKGADKQTAKKLSIKLEEEPTVTVPVAPIKGVLTMMESPLQKLLQEIDVLPSFITNFHEKLLDAVRNGEAAAYAQKESLLVEPVNVYMTIGSSLLDSDSGLNLRSGSLDSGSIREPVGLSSEPINSPTSLDKKERNYLAALYRLCMVNAVNVLSLRKDDLGSGKLLDAIEKAAQLTANLNKKINLSQIPADGFEIMPAAAYGTHKNLLALHEQFSKNL